MQFAGQRTDEEFNPIGEPYNMLIKLSDDTLPSPEASLVTKITPQMTQVDGYSEAEFCRILIEEIFTPDTTVVGFNNIRFDDEFIRYIFWRNFYDPYEWCWRDGRSRWDLLDVVRMTRALRPEGIAWPVTAEGVAVNKLERLTSENGISHENAHDALADVEALISVTKLIRDAQPQLFRYLLEQRDKKHVQQLINLEDKHPAVYTSGRYDNEFNKTTVVFPLAPAPNRNVLVYDLRYDPTLLFDRSVDELRASLFASWDERQQEGFVRVPVKVLQYNRCPAVAPVGVLEAQDGWEKISLTKEDVESHRRLLLSRPDFAEKLRTIFENRSDFERDTHDAEAALYDGFITDPKDVVRMEAVRQSSADALADLQPEFSDTRLIELLPRYKARSFPNSLTKDEQTEWETWRASRLKRQLPPFMDALKKYALSTEASAQFVLQELQLWAENILPIDE